MLSIIHTGDNFFIKQIGSLQHADSIFNMHINQLLDVIVLPYLSNKAIKLNSIYYSGDTRPIEDISRLRGVSTLIHEATFTHDFLEDAIIKCHSTDLEVLQVLNQLGTIESELLPSIVILTHFSQRNTKLPLYSNGSVSLDTYKGSIPVPPCVVVYALDLMCISTCVNDEDTLSVVSRVALANEMVGYERQATLLTEEYKTWGVSSIRKIQSVYKAMVNQ